jgi:hypothetical protein
MLLYVEVGMGLEALQIERTGGVLVHAYFVG